jgi:uncharacterized protein (DUF1810 family)
LREEHWDDRPFDLERFVAAQEPLLERALTELRAVRKRQHRVRQIGARFRKRADLVILGGRRMAEPSR